MMGWTRPLLNLCWYVLLICTCQTTNGHFCRLQYIKEFCMMTASNGNIFRVTGPLCGEFTGPGEFPTQRPVTRSFDVFFDLRLNKRLSKHSWGWWFETLSWSLWRHHNGIPLTFCCGSMRLDMPIVAIFSQAQCQGNNPDNNDMDKSDALIYYWLKYNQNKAKQQCTP